MREIPTAVSRREALNSALVAGVDRRYNHRITSPPPRCVLTAMPDSNDDSKTKKIEIRWKHRSRTKLDRFVRWLTTFRLETSSREF